MLLAFDQRRKLGKQRLHLVFLARFRRGHDAIERCVVENGRRLATTTLGCTAGRPTVSAHSIHVLSPATALLRGKTWHSVGAQTMAEHMRMCDGTGKGSAAHQSVSGASAKQ